MSAPYQIPPILLVGQEHQPVVLEFDRDIPICNIITLTFLDGYGQILVRLPVEKIGPRAIKLLLPVFDRSGNYTVVPKFDITENPNFPRFSMSILSEMETLQLLIRDSANKGTNHLPFIAALIAYIIQIEQNGEQVDQELTDALLYRAILKVENPLSCDLAMLLCGKYGQGSLLHFALHQKLVWTSDWLSREEVVGENKDKLLLSSYDQSTPAELARSAGLMKALMSIEKQLTDHRPYEPQTDVVSNHDTEKESQQQKIKKFGNKIAKAGKKAGKKMITAIKQTASTAAEDKEKPFHLADSFLTQLKITALYSAIVISPYQCTGSLSGNVELNVGDFVFVIREESDNMCKGIAHEKYCEFPLNILKPVSERTYQLQSDDDDEGNAYACDEDGSYESDESHEYEILSMDTIQAGGPAPPPPIKPKKQSHGAARSSSFDSGLNQLSTPLATYSPQLHMKPFRFQPEYQASHTLPGKTVPLSHQLHQTPSRPLPDIPQDRPKMATPPQPVSHIGAAATVERPSSFNLSPTAKKPPDIPQDRPKMATPPQPVSHTRATATVERQSLFNQSPTAKKPNTPTRSPLPVKPKFKPGQEDELSDDDYVSSSSYRGPELTSPNKEVPSTGETLQPTSSLRPLPCPPSIKGAQASTKSVPPKPPPIKPRARSSEGDEKYQTRTPPLIRPKKPPAVTLTLPVPKKPLPPSPKEQNPESNEQVYQSSRIKELREKMQLQ